MKKSSALIFVRPMFEVGLKLDSSRAMFQISMVNDM